MLSRRGTIAEGLFVLLVLVITCALGLSAVLLLSQVIRNTNGQSLQHNYNLIVVGASYALVLVVSIAFCLKRRLAVRRKLQRISKVYKTLEKGDVPKSVHQYILQEYTRTCLIAFESQPRDGVQEGWGRPGIKYADIHFRRSLLDTIPEIGKYRADCCSQAPEDGLTPLHYYDSAIQLARHSCREPSEIEYEEGCKAASEIKRILYECRLEMLEGSSTDLQQDTR
ncbi:hypothetical protein GLOTRDRAFT_30498 [Gloeophyllum trabeum ATCC 11539]|uniref:Defect at low temperature protein 1 n=1 Tax=Gloeophyllum trabeum (strain ATCC 11539 / FP-39264 / Madison 617) TaxID=670483 RepID=S7QN03_GLOTA|nr:uncharacterized protein GLOTRDRAFT_30498 [Gloeophyllum trabeum ATCC 11539]EPQ60873.1 hypothetical protein GLOTRDRAFT_30498 [Gloeophyllum trabeum ATCC 11539]